jgi:hypothetical protein
LLLREIRTMYLASVAAGRSKLRSLIPAVR